LHHVQRLSNKAFPRFAIRVCDEESDLQLLLQDIMPIGNMLRAFFKNLTVLMLHLVDQRER
jgi:hypothetical protein